MFKQIFVSSDTYNNLFAYVLESLSNISDNVDNYLKIPVHTRFSMSTNTTEIWEFVDKETKKEIDFEKIDVSKFNISNLLFKIKFIPYNPTYFQFIDKNGRFLDLIKKGFTFHNPTLTFKDRNVLLNLPFQAEKGHESSTNEISVKNDIQSGVDLGLIDFAVLNVEKNGRIIKRFFLGAKELFNMKFNRETGNLVYQNKCFNEYGNFVPHRLTNIKLRLINLHKEIKNIQRLKNEYEQRLISRGITNFRSKFKWNKLRRTLSRLWQKINNINSQIAKFVSHFIYEIARYYHVSIIKFEDLSWSTHSKKKDSGKFIARWQVHWLFSQMQTATADRCRSLGIKVGVVDAKNTSKLCSYCGALGIRKGKQFTCPECGKKLDSDLSACYNVVYRPIISYI